MRGLLTRQCSFLGTGSLPEVIRLATLALNSYAAVLLPNADELLVLRNRIIRLPFVESLLKRPVTMQIGSPATLLDSAARLYDGNAPSASTERDFSSNDAESSGSASDNPPHRVPAAPWLTITTKDEEASHLVSLFLAWINPTWRFVEQDLFLRGESRYKAPEMPLVRFS